MTAKATLSPDGIPDATADQPHARPIGYIFGTDSQHGVIPPGTQGVASYGGTDIWKLRSSDPSNFVRLHIPANFQRLKVKPPLGRCAVTLNLVTDPDLNPVVLAHANRFLQNYTGRVINHPRHVLESTREKQAQLLEGIDGLIAPKVARFIGRPNLALAAVDRLGLRFPAILRLTGSHGGEIVGVMPDREALAAAIAPDKTYFLTEFVESRAAGGFYHKFRVFYFGDEPIIRHRLVSDQWNIHAKDRKRVLINSPADIETERALLTGGFDLLPPPAKRVMTAIRKRIKLDFFGIDFAIMPDERVLLFEANATMSFLPLSTEPPFDYFAPMAYRARAAVDRMIGA